MSIPGKNIMWMCAIAIVWMTGCGPREVSPEVLSSFADLECRAVALRKQRFALADSIRFTQERKLKSNPADTLVLAKRLDSLNAQKNQLFNASLALADTIKHRVDSLFEHVLKKNEERTVFNQQLETILQNRGCE